MAKVSFLPDQVREPLDTKLEEIGAQALLVGRPIRLRVQPNLYNLDKQGYDSWSGVVWTLDLDDIEEGRRFREALEKFMALFGDVQRQKELLVVLERLL